MAKYSGPSDTFIYGGKEYHPGDDMPISAAAMRHHEQYGHRWAGSPEDAPIVPATMSAPLSVPAVVPPVTEHAAPEKS